MKKDTVKTVSKTARKMAVKDAPKAQKTAEKAPKAPKAPAPKAEKPATPPQVTLPKMLQAEADKGTLDTAIFALKADADAGVLMVALDELREMKRRIKDALKSTEKWNEKHPGNKQATEHFQKAVNYIETAIEKYKGLHAAAMRTDRLNTRLAWKMGAFSRLANMATIK